MDSENPVVLPTALLVVVVAVAPVPNINAGFAAVPAPVPNEKAGATVALGFVPTAV